MSPFIRGRIIPETESTGRAKRTFDVLLWLPQPRQSDLVALHRIQILREYLASFVPSLCAINLWVPFSFQKTAESLARLRVPFTEVQIAQPSEAIRLAFKQGCPNGMMEAASTALCCDADVVVACEFEWFPYFEEFEKLNMRLVDSLVLQRQSEIFVRGHGVPWSFDYMVWNEPWTAFYVLGEPTTFQDGLRFLEICYKKNLDPGPQDTARMLVHNRLPNLCFTRDRLLFYELQQAAAKRARWQRQDFAFEAGYYLNFYYLLIYGGFDHLALVVDGALRLGLPEKQVGAVYEPFLTALQAKAPEIHAIFINPEVVEFIQRIGALRHFAAHRGSIMPGKLYEKPNAEPTVEELDGEIAKWGLDRDLRLLPEGPLRDSARNLLRFKVKLSKYKEIAGGIVPIEIKGNWYFITPMADTEWNFSKFHKVLVSVLNACANRI